MWSPPPFDETRLLGAGDWVTAWCADAPKAAAALRARLARITEAERRAPSHAWITLGSEARLNSRLDQLLSLATAHPAEERTQRYPLFGVPFAVKDNIDAAGWPTTAACAAWSQIAQRDATAVRKLLDAGAVLVGKTNLDQFATGLVGTRSPFGAPASVFDANRVSGGSSSGSSVAVARGDVAFALGTDTAGSGRVPAGFNNLVGLKPTPGRVSTAGVLPACRSLDCVSVFALTVDDAARVLSVIEGPDDADEYSAFSPGSATMPLGLRVGVPREPRVDAALGYDQAWAAAIQALQAMDRPAPVHVTQLDFEPLHAVARLLYEGPWVAERYLAVRPLIERDPAALEPTVARIIAGASRWSATDTFAAQYQLQRARAALQALWNQVDVLMVPTAPRHPRFDEVAADPIGANAELGAYTNFVNLLGWSALALPGGFTAQGLPFGITFIGPACADAALARLGQQWQSGTLQRQWTLGATARSIDAASVHAQGPWPASEATMPIAVVGAHLSGLPLNGQLLDRGATFVEATRTAPHYRLYELPDSRPPKPGLQRVAEGGASIELEVWRLPQHAVGSFLALIPSPLGLGSIELDDGRLVHGFLCEAHALQGARDITAFGGWRAWLRSR